MTISCIIPTHQRPEFLALALQSVTSQSVQPYEVIVASDVDSPASEEVCHDHEAASGVPIRYVYDPQTRGGASASRNIGARQATGDVLAFLDDDDVWEPSYLERVQEQIARPGKDMAVTWRMLVKGDFRTPGPTIEEGLVARDVVAVSMGTTGSNMALTRASYERISGFDELIPVKNDTDFFYRFLKAGYDYGVVREYLVLQVKHGTGQLTGNSIRRAEGTRVYLEKHKADLRFSDRRHLRLSMHRIYYHLATNPIRKYFHLGLALANYSPAKYLKERELRKMFLAIERSEPGDPSDKP